MVDHVARKVRRNSPVVTSVVPSVVASVVSSRRVASVAEGWMARRSNQRKLTAEKDAQNVLLSSVVSPEGKEKDTTSAMAMQNLKDDGYFSPGRTVISSPVGRRGLVLKNKRVVSGRAKSTSKSGLKKRHTSRTTSTRTPRISIPSSFLTASSASEVEANSMILDSKRRKRRAGQHRRRRADRRGERTRTLVRGFLGRHQRKRRCLRSLVQSP